MSYITDEQIGQIAEQVGLVGPASRVDDCHAASLRFARALLDLATPGLTRVTANANRYLWWVTTAFNDPALLARVLADCNSPAEVDAAIDRAINDEFSEAPRES